MSETIQEIALDFQSITSPAGIKEERTTIGNARAAAPGMTTGRGEVSSRLLDPAER